mgnify:CR=1 FL=1
MRSEIISRAIILYDFMRSPRIVCRLPQIEVLVTDGIVITVESFLHGLSA